MGILSTIGKLAGTAIGAFVGGPGGAKIGGTIGGMAGGAVEGGKKKSSGSQQQQFIPMNEKISLADIRGGSSSPSAMDILSRRSADTKVAKAVGTPDFGKSDKEEDPWVPMGQWWVDLGGEPGRLKKIDDTRY